MKVLHLINTLSAGGAELHLLTLCRQLRAQGIEPIVVCLREHVKDSRSLRPDFARAGIQVIDLNADSRYDSRFFVRIARVMAAEQPALLHTHLPRADLAGAFAQFLRPSIPWVCSVHADYSADWSGRWSLPLIRILWRRANLILCISHAVRDWLIHHGMPPEKARVIHYGIETEQFAHSRTDVRELWGIKDRIVVGTIGRLEPRKGHQYVIEAMPELCRRIPNALLLIAGHDPWSYGKVLRQLIKSLHVEGNVRMVGFQNDIVSFLHALDAFVFATTSEGFGQVLVEAMAAGRAVVASRVPPLTEIAVNGQSALLVEPGKPAAFAAALSQLLSDPVGRQRMGRHGRERVQRYFTAARMASETISLYEEACGQIAQLRSLA